MSETEPKRRHKKALEPDGVVLRNATLRQGNEPWPEELKAALRSLYETVGMRSVSRTIRAYRDLFGPEDPLPTAGVIRMWVLRHEWGAVPSDRNRQRRIRQSHERQLDNLELAQEVHTLILMKAHDEDASDAMLYLANDVAKFTIKTQGTGTHGAQGGGMDAGSADDVPQETGEMTQEMEMRMLRDQLASDRENATA